MSGLIAIDIGGTQMRAACYPPDGLKPLKINKISTQHATETAWDRLVQLVISVWPDDDQVNCIGVAVPGPTDPFQGVLFSAPNIHAWVNIPLAKLLQERFGVPVVMGNDANLAALGEWKYGAGIGHHHVVYLTISTGIGSGIIIDDRLLLGTRGLAAELGHVTVLPEGPLCGCGQRGHLEALASGPSIARWVTEQISDGVPTSLSQLTKITAKLVAEAARSGDALALQAFNRAGTFVGQSLADILHIFNPTIVIIGGGVAQSGALLMDPLRRAMKRHVMDTHYLESLTLTTAALGDDTGLMGALALTHHQF
jgi:glucokinase